MRKYTSIVIGSGFSGLSSAAYLAQAGFEVDLFEKNDSLGGRARSFSAEGFTFDMGPSWYWMPEIFEHFFSDFGTSLSKQYEVKRLDPSYRVFFGKDDVLDIPAGQSAVEDLFDSIDKGSGQRLNKFLREARYKYEIGMNEFVHKPGHSIFEFIDLRIFKSLFQLDLLKSVTSAVSKVTKDPRLSQILEFPVLFLGATPWKTPALYTMMNYADISLGTWYPLGGMHQIINAMVDVCKAQGVRFHLNTNVEAIVPKSESTIEVKTNCGTRVVDKVIASADYHHVDQHLLPTKYKQYSPAYWNKRILAPSSLLFYLGVDKKIKNLEHHNLFFDRPFGQHAKEIYEQPSWPSDPLFYVCCPSKTDDTAAPNGKENLFILIPVATGIEDNEEIREDYFKRVMERLEELTGEKIRPHISYKKSYAQRDFIKDYNAFKGNAYGLANTLSQTAFLKPKLRHKKINNLFFCGQLTTPGPGVPPSIISGKVAAREVIKSIQ